MAVVSGGTTLIDNGALDAGVPTGSLILLSTQTASASASLDFTSGIDSTYDSYVFKFIDIHPATDNVSFTFQADTGTNTNYNQTVTSTNFSAYNYEDNSGASLGYNSTHDQAQGTSFERLVTNLGNDNDQSCSGTLQIFNPSSSTFVKHYIARTQMVSDDNRSTDRYNAGYFNTTTALTRFRFKMSSGNIDDGIIKMYGVA